MRILMVNHFPLAGSGSGTYTKNLAVQLAAAGNEVCVILPENTKDYERVDGIRIHPVYFTPEDGSDAPEGALPFNFPCFTSHPRSTETFGDLTEAELGQYMDAFGKAIREETEEFGPDIVHGQHVWILPYLAIAAGLPMVITAHGTDLMGCSRWPHLKHYAEAVMEYAGAVISISKDNFALIEEMFPGYTDKVVMMRNGYDPGVFYPEQLSRDEVLGAYGIKPEEYEGRRIVSFAGKLANFKGVDVLLDAAAIYAEREPATLTLIIGDGDEREALHAQAERLGLNAVRFLGNVDQRSLRRLYNIADVDLVPSRREPFGLVAIEAMGCGIPVIASDQGGLPDFVNESVGRLVAPEDAEDLAAGVAEVLERIDSCDFAEWRREIHKYARENYAQDKIIHELIELYDSVI